MDRGSYLKSLRLGKGMTQVQAGKLVGVDHSLIGKYEKNSVNIPSDKLEKLAEVYGVAVGDIMSAGGKTLDHFKSLKLVVSKVKNETGIQDYQNLPDELKNVLTSAALEALRSFYNAYSLK